MADYSARPGWHTIEMKRVFTEAFSEMIFSDKNEEKAILCCNS
jgi:hypothetical protein